MAWTLTTPNYTHELYDAMLNTHTLVAGTTGCGKSNLIDNFILYAIERATPSSLNFALCDPKKVCLRKYITLPHACAYADDYKSIVDVLESAICEMMKRYEEMKAKGIEDYDGRTLIVIIDELADLMITDGKTILPKLQKIAQLGRAAKVRLLCATQCPNRKTIPSELTLNFTTRIGMNCVSAIESKQIIGVPGCESLPKHGRVLVSFDGIIKNVDINLLDRERLDEVTALWRYQAIENKFSNGIKSAKNKKHKSLVNISEVATLIGTIFRAFMPFILIIGFVVLIYNLG